MHLTPEQQTLVVSAMVVVVLAFLGYLAAMFTRMTATVAVHTAKLDGPITRIAENVDKNTSAIAEMKGASTAGGQGSITPSPALNVPLYNQHNDPNPDGLPDRFASTDCGWECCCVVARACRGIAVAVGDARTQLHGRNTPGISSLDDLVGLLAFWKFSPHAHNVLADEALTIIVGSLALAHPCITLGYWVDRSFLHWVTIIQETDTHISYEDPWTGRILAIPLSDFRAKYAGVVIDVGEPTRYSV